MTTCDGVIMAKLNNSDASIEFHECFSLNGSDHSVVNFRVKLCQQVNKIFNLRYFLGNILSAGYGEISLIFLLTRPLPPVSYKLVPADVKLAQIGL